MRKSVLPVLALAITLFSFSCNKKDAADILDNVSATIGTTSFSTTSINKNYATSGNPTQLTVTADGSNGEYLVFAIKNFNKTSPLGTYTITSGSTSQGIGAYHKAGASADEIATSGQIIITLNGNGGDAIGGSFDFTTQQGTHVSNGSFFVVLP
jgi:hypothetical protein